MRLPYNFDHAIRQPPDRGYNKQAILDSGIPPSDNAESAIVRTLSPGPPYTAIVRGVSNSTGVAVVEIYALP